MPKKAIVAVEDQPTDTEIESGSSLTSDLESRILDQIGPAKLSKVKRIAYYLVNIGLPIEEACVLVDLPFQEYSDILEECPLVQQVIRKKELEYKKDLLHVITSRARSGDDKLALWLLERKYPEEFSTKRKPADDGDDILMQGLSFVQRHGDASPLVGETSGKAFIIKQKKTGNILKTIEQLLSTKAND